MSPRGAIGFAFAFAKAYEKAKRQAEAEKRRQERALQKHLKWQYLREQVEDVDKLNKKLNGKIIELQSLLDQSIKLNDTEIFESLRIRDEFPPFNPPQYLTTPNPIPQKETFFSSCKPLGFWGRIIPGSKNRYKCKLLRAELESKEALQNYKKLESERNFKLQKLKEDYEKEKQAFYFKKERTNAEIDDFESYYQKGDHKAIIAYNSIILQRSPYPKEFPKRFQLTYSPNSKELIIDYELPPPEIIPLTSEYRYVKSRHMIVEKKRKISDIKATYLNIIYSMAIRTIYEVFEADRLHHLQAVLFNGYAKKAEPNTDQATYNYLISLCLTKEIFAKINFDQIKKNIDLIALDARVSPNPIKLIPIKPITKI